MSGSRSQDRRDPLHGPNRTDLRQGFNKITVSEGRWTRYRFDEPPSALPLEASTGSGDSGGPLLVAVGDEWQVAGITAWKRGLVTGKELHPGKYAETSCGVRLAHYREWIRGAISTDGPVRQRRAPSRLEDDGPQP